METTTVVKLSIAPALGLEEKSEEFKLIERITSLKNGLKSDGKRNREVERKLGGGDGAGLRGGRIPGRLCLVVATLAKISSETMGFGRWIKLI